MSRFNQIFYYLKIRGLLILKPASFFNQINHLEWYKSTLQNWIESNNVAPKSKILEVGCATGVLTEYLFQSDYLPTGIDLAEGMINIAKENNPNIPFRVADVTSLPFDDNSFDSVISASVINIVSDKEKALREMARVCKQSGEISILAPLKNFSDSEFNNLQDTLKLSGFSRAALKSWHELAPKMTVIEVEQLLQKSGLEAQEPKKYLNGMLFSITAKKLSQQ